ncbi:hypothetical protein Tco_0959686 [Tanacetum coccineum]
MKEVLQEKKKQMVFFFADEELRCTSSSALVEVEDDVNSFNKEGGSSAASEHVNLDAGYDSSFEDGSSKEPNVTRGRRKKKSKKDSWRKQ